MGRNGDSAAGNDMNNIGNRIPSLDGARAISIALVILSHLQVLSSVPVIWRLDTGDLTHYAPFLDYGNLGVRVFFVISGFLITHLLLTERERTGRIDLGAFYARRFLRIMPAYWLYLIVIAVLIAHGLVRDGWRDLAAAALYVSDYHTPPRVLTHTWSLSVEEQFYALWPLLLVVIGARRAPWAVLAVVLLSPAFRVLSDAGLWPSSAKFAFEAAADALAMGCLLALVRERLWSASAYRGLISSHVPGVLVLAGLLLAGKWVPYAVRDALALPLINVGIALLLDRWMRFPDRAMGRLLNARPIAWVGTVSYSLYIWQELFVRTEWPLAAKLACLLGCAIASHYLIERPCLTLRARFRGAPAPAPVAAAA
jgi:peptidoglycan/LPS O-acetylase OafA/YrhL